MGSRDFTKFSFRELSSEEIFKFAQKLKPKTSMGVDGVSNKILKFILPAIILPLKHIINLSLITGFFHKIFKTSKVIPIFKSECNTNFNNYRPISLLSPIAKLIEKIVAFQLTNFCNDNKIFHQNQFGFRSNHNTIQPLMLYTKYIYD